MKTLVAFCLSGLALLSAHAGSHDEAIVAAMGLGESANYSWTTSVRDDAQAYKVEGKTSPEGYVRATLPMVQAVAERLGRDSDTQLEAIFKERTFVLRLGRRWITFAELPEPIWVPDEVAFFNPPYDPLDPIPVVVPPSAVRERERQRPYSNARLAVAPPHEELAIIVSNYTEMEVDDHVVSGKLNPLGAGLLLCPGDRGARPLAASGTFRLWIRNGIVTRYQLRLEGLLTANREKVLMRQDSDTVIKDIGHTALEIPEEARRKLPR